MKIEITIEESGHAQKIIFVKPKKIELLRKKDTGIIGWMLRGGDKGDAIHSEDCPCSSCNN